ncbi:CinA family protein [Sphingobacterium bambusae]|uniref:CinA family protein n=1 Tax=Sphingobacterium bambusae TaxID=662858 RepID=A0ABW6BC21_9SPHI|nr:nicotinamide-nucleotide amidohydrolase family protein [Sphingobacterium bambusae]WPL48899.1 nicotinamide-nucleotide amidohydrolase family protein [Sphingobacterium bambusae]
MSNLKQNLVSQQIDEQALRNCADLFCVHGIRLMCAESMTAGFLSSLWAMESQSSRYFLGSLICYSDTVKTKLLQVPSIKIWKFCAESAVVTLRLLDGLRKYASFANLYVSVTGLAYKSSNGRQKRPIGTVYYAFAYRDELKIFKRQFAGSSAQIFIATCNALLSDLHNWLLAVLRLEKEG